MAAPSSPFPVDRLGSEKIVIATFMQGGYGDLICALKVAALFHEKLGVPKENILVCAYRIEEGRLSKKHLEALNSKHHFEILSSTTDREDIAFSIAVPYDSSISKCVDIKKVPTAAISEYSYQKEAVPAEVCGSGSFGFAVTRAAEIGILISDDLKEWGFSEESKDPLKRLEQLTKASEEVRKALFGKEAITAEDLAKFNEESKLYFGYAFHAKTIISFILAVAKMNQEIGDKRDLCFACPIKIPEILKLISPTERGTISPWLEHLLSSLDRVGVREFEIKTFTGASLNTCSVETTATKKITLFVGTIPYSDTSLLLMGSEKETVVTGDQSLSEAISANKCFFYETLEHKMDLAADLSLLWERHSASPCSICFSSPKQLDEATYAMELLFQAELTRGYEGSSAFNRYIVDTKDSTSKIAALGEALLRRHKES